MASGQPELSRHEALAILGVQEGVSTADLRRAFKARALQSHPDKTRQHVSASDAAFKRLVAAYQCLTQPAAAKTWAELDMSDILSDAFFAEAFAQELPAFEMMYIHTHMPSAPGQVAVPSSTPPPHHHPTSSAVSCPAAALKADTQPPNSAHPDPGQHQLPCSGDAAGQQVLPLHGGEQLNQKEEEEHSYTEQQQGQRQQGQQQQGQQQQQQGQQQQGQQQQGQQQQGQQGMVSSVSQAVQGPMPQVWADELPSQTGLRDATWRRIHEAVQRKAEKARARAAGQVPSKPHRPFLHRQAQRWSLLWALLADLLRPDPAAFVLVDQQERIVCIAPSTSSGPSRALVPFKQPGRQQRLQASLQGDGLQLATQPAACAGGGAGMVCLDSVAHGQTLTKPGKLGSQAGLLNAMPEPDASIDSQGCGAAAAMPAAAEPAAPAAVRELATVGAGVGTAAAKEEPTTAGPGEGEVTLSAESTVDAAPEAKAPAAGQSGASSSVHVIPVTTFIALPRHKQRHALAARPASSQPPVLKGYRQPSATSSQQHGHGSVMSGSECGATAVLALCSAVPGQKDVAVPDLDLTTLRRRTSLRFYWMWAKRMLVAKAVLMLLRQR